MHVHIYLFSSFIALFNSRLNIVICGYTVFNSCYCLSWNKNNKSIIWNIVSILWKSLKRQENEIKFLNSGQYFLISRNIFETFYVNYGRLEIILQVLNSYGASLLIPLVLFGHFLCIVVTHVVRQRHTYKLKHKIATM